jgi:hypothetical protein
MKALNTYINESSKFSAAEMMEDIKKVRDAYELKDKKAIAEKYGIQSKKIAEIEKGILQRAAEERATRTKFDTLDISLFRLYSNYVDMYNKLSEYLELEPEGFIIFMKDYYEEDLKKDKIFQYLNWRPADMKYRLNYNQMCRIKYYQSLVRYINEHGSSTKNQREAKENATDLILGKLDEQLAEFKEQLLNQVEEQAKDYWQRLSDGLEKWHKEYLKARKAFNDYTADHTRRYSLPEVMAEYNRLEEAGKLASQKYHNAKFIVEKWTKEEYGKYCREQGRKEYEYKKHKMAEKIVERDFDYSNLTFSNMKRDPKGIEMLISDGVKKVYARSIIAAQFSEKVICHFRFILTDRK